MPFVFFALMAFVAGLVLIGLVYWFVARFYLRGDERPLADRPPVEHFAGDPTSAGQQSVLAQLERMSRTTRAAPRIRRLPVMRQAMDDLVGAREFDASFTDVDADGVRAEWVLAPGADSVRRLLYIHGGAFVAGSPRSHRSITTSLSRLTGCAVLAIDYRLMPLHTRRAGIEDCRRAYRWLLDHGPAGSGAARTVFVAGDSAGGNLTLSLIAWVRDQGLRSPTAAVALSPLTDSTLSSPSIRANLATDVMLGPAFAPLLRLPQAALLWTTWLQTRTNPRDPAISPVYGDLARLPPVLVHVSECEMLLDDGRRWVERARAVGTPARLQVWSHMVHVWQLFNPELPEANQALGEIAKFLAAAERALPAKADSPVSTPSALAAQH